MDNRLTILPLGDRLSICGFESHLPNDILGQTPTRYLDKTVVEQEPLK